MTTDERLEMLARELARAKRRTRWVLLTAILAAGAFGVAWGFGRERLAAQAASGVAKEVRANKFVVVDENGKTRAVLVAGKDGVGLALNDENGKVRAELPVFKDGPALSLKDEKGKTRAHLGTSKTSTPRF